MTRGFLFAVFLCLCWCRPAWPVGRPLGAEVLCFLKGNIQLPEKKFDVSVDFKDKGTVTAQLVSTSKDQYRVNLELDHFKTSFFDISTVFQISLELMRKEEGLISMIRGTVDTKYSLANYKPLHELSGYFEIKEGKLYLNALSWAQFLCDGFLNLLPPYEMDLSFQFDDLDMQEYAQFSGCGKNETTTVKGRVSGNLRLSGFPDKPMLKGRLISDGGFVQGLAYDRMSINFEGLYPVVEIVDSRVTEETGLSFNLEGRYDLRGYCNPLEGMIAMRLSPLIDENQTHRIWTIKQEKDAGTENTTEFRYRLKKQLNAGDPSYGDSDLLGVERSIKF